MRSIERMLLVVYSYILLVMFVVALGGLPLLHAVLRAGLLACLPTRPKRVPSASQAGPKPEQALSQCKQPNRQESRVLIHSAVLVNRCNLKATEPAIQWKRWLDREETAPRLRPGELAR
jgi:hypothetical protein